MSLFRSIASRWKVAMATTVTVFSVRYAEKRSNMIAVVTGVFSERYMYTQGALRKSHCSKRQTMK